MFDLKVIYYNGTSCFADDFIDPPTEVKLLSASTKSITIGWQVQQTCMQVAAL